MPLYAAKEQPLSCLQTPQPALGLKVKTHIKAGITMPKLDGSSKDAS
jgi:hypothetical protein